MNETEEITPRQNTATSLLLLKQDFGYMKTALEDLKKNQASGFQQLSAQFETLNNNVGKVYTTKEESNANKALLEAKIEANKKEVKEIKDGFSRVLWAIGLSVLGAFVVWILRGGLSGGL